jgi:hypothetical protein
VLGLTIKYYVRNNCWSYFIPYYILLLEIALPFKLTIFSFIFLRKVFNFKYRLTPLDLKQTHLSNTTYFNYLLINESVVLFSSLIIIIAISCTKYVYFSFVYDEYNYVFFYDFFPYLIFSILIGNINSFLDFKFSNFTRGINIIFSFLHPLVILNLYIFLSLNTQLAIAIFTIIAALLIVVYFIYLRYFHDSI